MNAPGTRRIQTERLLLRRFTMEDVESVYHNYGSDPEVNRYISFAPCGSLESTEGFIGMHIEQYENNPEFYGWAVTLDDEVIGSIGLFNVDDADQCELGYSIGSRWWGKGYATEAARAVVKYAFEEIGAHRVYASHHIENLASGHVLEKTGMHPEGILRDAQKNVDGTYSDLKLYAVLENEWRERIMNENNGNTQNLTDAEKINKWLNECVEQSGTFFLTTIDGNKPKSRPISFHMLKDGVNYFGVGEMKEVYRQMQENPYVEITGLMGNGKQFLRYYGKAVFAEGTELAKEALEQPGYPVMKKIYAEGTGHVFGVFHLEDATCERRAMMSVIEVISD